MSMTTVNGKLYVSRVLGGTGSQESQDEAGEAILRAYQDWQAKQFWSFLLKDTTKPFAISITTASNTTVTPVTAGDLDFVNVGMTFTNPSFTGTVTVTAVTRGTDGVVTSITVDGTASASSTTTATWNQTIPIVAGTNDYALPNDFNSMYTLMMVTNQRVLTKRDRRYWDRNNANTTQRGTPSEYTTYNPYSDQTQNFGTQRLAFDCVPDTADTLLARYYRKFNTTGTYIDVPDDLLYQFLDYARGLLVANKAAKDNPAAFLKSVADGAEAARENDMEPSEDNDVDQCMKASYESPMMNRRLWGNGAFDEMR